MLLAFILFAYVGYAQNQGPTPEQRAQQMTMAMMQHLRLSGAQAAKVKEINLTSIKQMEQAKKDLKANPREFMVTAGSISSTRLSALKEVLTPAQFALYNQHREKKMGIPQEGGPGAGPGNRALEEYGN